MNLVEKLLAVNPEELKKVEEKTIEIKRLSEKIGEPFMVTCRPVIGDRYFELAADVVDEDGNADLSKGYDVQVLIALEGMVSPNLKDGTLQKHFGAATPKELMKILFNGGEITRIADLVSDLSGYGKDSERKVKN